MFDAVNGVVISLSARIPTAIFAREKGFPQNSNPRPRASSRRQWFVLSPSSGDTAVQVFQNPYQPMLIRADLAPGPSCPRRFCPYKHVHRTMLRLRDRGLQVWAVSTGATVTCATSRPRLSTIRLSMTTSKPVKLAVSRSSSLKKLFTLCLDLSFPDIEIASFNAFRSDPILAVICSSVGGQGPWTDLSSPSSSRSKPYVLHQVASFFTARRCLRSLLR